VSTLNIGQLVVYNNDEASLFKRERLHNKIGIIIQHYRQKIYSPYLESHHVEYTLYHVLIDNNVYILGVNVLVDYYDSTLFSL